MSELTLTQKLAAITQEIGAIKKEKKPGATVSYAYRGIDDVMNKLNPLLGRHHITIQSKVLSHNLTQRTFTKFNSYSKQNEEKNSYYATVHLQLIFSDGKEQESFEEVAMSEDYGDKAMTQAMSMAYKYAVTRKFCILTADVVDPDSRNPNDEEKPQQPAPPTKEPAKTTVAKTKQPTPEELEAIDQWKQVINNCTTIDELVKHYTKNKALWNSTPAIYEAFKAKGTQLKKD
jgi:hypothetical protein